MYSTIYVEWADDHLVRNRSTFDEDMLEERFFTFSFSLDL